MVKNVLSVDLESFIHREFNLSKRKTDNGFTIKATNYLLDLLDSYKTKTTFFVVGEIYEWYPQLIDRIQKKGHELAFHSHRHIEINTREILLEELNLSKEFLNTYKPVGFRAPRIYFKKEFLPILREYGFQYDSSTYGIFQNATYSGIKEIPVSILPYGKNAKNHDFFSQKLLETLFRKGIPYGSGLFMSLLQNKIDYFIRQTNSQGLPAILFIHPWQLFDYEQSFSPRFLLYRRKIDRTLRYLLSRHTFASMKELL